MRTRLLLLSALALPACSDDPVSYSAPVGISLDARSSDVVSGTITSEKNINTESGNPYAAYIAAARDELGGDPGSITLDETTFAIVDGTTGVTTLGEIFDGDVDISFVMNSTDTVYPAAVLTVTADTGAGPVEAHSHFDDSTVTDEDWPDFVGGNFKVLMTAPAADSFAAADADANLEATFTFSAYE